MADRAVSVRLMAKVDQYKAGMADAANATKKFGSDSVTHTKSVSNELASVSNKSMLVGGALIGMAGIAVAAFAQFDKQMSGVQAVTGATSEEMLKLRDAAMQAGKSTVFSATEAAQAETELAKAGVSTSDIMGGALTGSLALAAAGQIAVADAASISATAMKQFGLAGTDVTHIADVLTAAANKAQGSVSDVGVALKYVGPVAHQMGVSLDETVGVIAELASNGVLADQAGTSMRGMLMALTSPSGKAAAAMQDLGINVYDTAGNFIGFGGVAQQMQDKLGKLTNAQRDAAFGVIFGNEQITTARVLYAGGAAAVGDWTSKVNDQGIASRQAAIQMDNLAGDLNNLQSSIETALISSGSEANGVLRDMAKAATDVINFIGAVPGPILGVGIAITAVSGAALVAVPRIVAFNAALAKSPAMAKSAAVALKGLAAAAVVTIFAGFILDARASNQATDDLITSIADLRASLGKGFKTDDFTALTDKVSELRDKLTAAKDPGIVATIEDLGNLLTNTDYVSPVQKLTAALKDASVSAGDVNSGIGNAAGALGITFAQAVDLANQGGIKFAGTSADITDAIVLYGHAQTTGGVATRKAADAMDVLAGAIVKPEDALKALKDEWDATTGAMLGTSDATIAAEAALDAMTKSIKDNGKSFDIHTAKGRANQSQINDSIRAFEALRVQEIETGNGSEAATKKANDKMVAYLTTLRAGLPASAKTAKAEIDALIAKFKTVPKVVPTTVTVGVNGALNDIHSVATYWASTAAWITAHPAEAAAHYGSTSTAKPSFTGKNGPPAVPHGAKMASGGLVGGPGTKTSDSVAMRLSRGEFVQQASAVDKYGPAFMHAVNAGTYRPASAAGGATVTIGGSGVPVVVQIGEQQLVSALLRFKRGNGGVELGIA